MTEPKRWAAFKTHARKLVPSRAVRWTFIYGPILAGAVLFALRIIGGLDDLIAYVMEAGARSVHVVVAIAIVYGLSTGLGWNLDNKVRADYQRQLIAGRRNAPGAFLVLAGEAFSILMLLYLILRAFDLIVVKG